jgi:hypothetical protein
VHEPYLNDILLAGELRLSNQFEAIVGSSGMSREDGIREAAGERGGARENTSTNSWKDPS